ncbi:MAG: hypothetical protein WDN24_12240 [Sphingomonas sp.]
MTDASPVRAQYLGGGLVWWRHRRGGLRQSARGRLVYGAARPDRPGRRDPHALSARDRADRLARRFSGRRPRRLRRGLLQRPPARRGRAAAGRHRERRADAA